LRRLGCIAPHLKALPYLNGLVTQVSLGRSSRDVVSRIDAGQFERLLNWLVDSIRSAGGAVDGGDPYGMAAHQQFGAAGYGVGRLINVPELSLALTPIGIELVDACSGPPGP